MFAFRKPVSKKCVTIAMLAIFKLELLKNGIKPFRVPLMEGDIVNSM